MRIFKHLVILVLFLFVATSSIYAHSGRTDANGGHKDNKNVSRLGYYHYHHGLGPHLHTNGVCPYDYDDKTILGSGSNSTGSGGGNGIISRSAKKGTFYDVLLNHPIVTLFGLICIVYLMYTYIISRKEQKEHARKFEEERTYYKHLYNGKSLLELAQAPQNINFGDDGLPISVDDSGLQWGKDFTVYVTKSGNCFHRKCGCCGASYIKHIFNARRIGCSKCVKKSEILYKYPEWYNEYLKIKNINSKYNLDIK